MRAVGLWTGLAKPRGALSTAEAAVVSDLARGRRRIVLIGVHEGASAVLLCEAMHPTSELHLVDGFGRHPNAGRPGRSRSERAARRVVARAARRGGGPDVEWHVGFSASIGADWTRSVDLLVIDGDHSEIGVATDWELWHGFVADGGAVLFADARASQPDGRGLAGPTAVVDRLFRGPRRPPDWRIRAEVGGVVAVLHEPRAA